MTDRLLSIKELAAGLGRGRTYVHAMKRDGFRMPGNRARLSAAELWLEDNPDFRANRPLCEIRKAARKCRTPKGRQTDITDFCKTGIRCQGEL